MSEAATKLERAANFLARHKGMILPVAAAALIFVILVPLPPAVIDILLAANIALAAIILLTTVYVASPLEFSVFPSVLLGATLFRLVLNVATTRLILTAGAEGRTVQDARVAAGHVIWSFSEFVASGSLAVGLIIFAIIVVVQFVVVTRGAGRISEVAARFVLDAMPGKQAAIDADLNAGLIDQAEARRQRARVAREADFYGAMDGASRFLRGDAIAAVLITLVNILGGIYVGMVQYGWSWQQTAALFTRLTIGDGLVTQIPAFIVAVAAALIITRSTARTNLGEEVVSQLTSRPVALVITAAFLAALALTSLPKLPLLVLGIGCAGLAWVLFRRRGAAAQALAAGREAEAEPAAAPAPAPAPVLAVDPLRVEVGFALVPLVEPGGGELLGRIGDLRRELADELGLLLPPIRIRDNLRLRSHEYVLRIRGAKAASGRLYRSQVLAVADGSPGAAAPRGELAGREADAEAFGGAAMWIDPSQRSAAVMMGYAVLEPPAALMRHLSRTVRRHAAELLSREQVAGLLAGLEAGHAHLVADAREKLKLARIHKVLQRLLREGVPIRDLETILEAAADAAEHADDVDAITEHVRAALAATISQHLAAEDGKLYCVCLDPSLEQTLAAHLSAGAGNGGGAVPPDVARGLGEAVRARLGELRGRSRRPVILCGPSVRAAVREIIAAAEPDAAVLAYNEVSRVEVKSIAEVGTES
jgi:flagellar biosynthesis protein FlhA